MAYYCQLCINYYVWTCVPGYALKNELTRVSDAFLKALPIFKIKKYFKYFGC